MKRLVLLTGGEYSDYSVAGLFQVESINYDALTMVVEKCEKEYLEADHKLRNHPEERARWSRAPLSPECQELVDDRYRKCIALQKARNDVQAWILTQEPVPYVDFWAG